MDHLEGIFTCPLDRLGQQYHVSEAYPGHGDFRLAVRLPHIVIARHRTVFFHQILVNGGCQIPPEPGVEIPGIDPLGMLRSQITLPVPLGITVENRPLLHEKPFKGLFVGGKPVQIITGIAQGPQEVVQGRHDFQACRRQGCRTGPLEIINGDLLLLIRFPFQFQIVVNRLAKAAQAFRNRLEQIQPILVLVLDDQSIRQDSPVYFRHYQALAQETAHHALLVGHPLVVSGIHGQRTEQGNVLSAQPIHGPVPLPHRQAAMRQVDSRIGLDFLQEVQTFGKAGNRIDAVSPVLERQNDGIQMLGVGVERPCDTGHECDFPLAVLVEAMFFEPGFVFGYRVEAHVLAYMEKAIGIDFPDWFDGAGEQALAAKVFADIVEQAAEIGRSPVAQPGFHLRLLRAVQIANVVVGAGDRETVKRHAFISQTLHFGPVFFRDPQAHGKHQDGIVLFEPGHLVHAQGVHLDKGISRRPDHLGHLEILEIQQGNPRGGRQEAP